MFCEEYEMTGCNTKLCCHDCNKQCKKRCKIKKADCDCLRESEPAPHDERYIETQLN